jgi:hypothetical protein
MSLLLLFHNGAPASGSRCARASIVNLLVPSTLAPVAPDGTIDQGDRQQAAKAYCGILSVKHYFFTASPGAYVITGADTNYGIGNTVSPGTYTWTGVATSHAISGTLSPGSYAITGTATLLRNGPIYYLYMADALLTDLGVRMSAQQLADSGVRISDVQLGDLNVRISGPVLLAPVFEDSGVRISDPQLVDLNVRISDPKRKKRE